jgi:hypothetical protein
MSDHSDPTDQDLTDEERAVADDAARKAVERLRESRRLDKEARERWQPVLDELEEVEAEADDGSMEMAQRFIERTKLCGWNEDTDQRLQGLVIGLVEILGLNVRRHRRTGEVIVR